MILCQNCLSKIDNFAALKPKYTPQFVQDIMDSATAAFRLPDFRQRQNMTSRLVTILGGRGGNCCTNFMTLMYYAGDAFAPEELESKKIEAGWENYTDASRNQWNAVTELNTTMSTFISNNSSALSAAGMTEDFPATCEDANAAFASALTDYTMNKNIVKSMTSEKTEANNAVYERLKGIMTDGKFIFKNNPLIREQFSYAAVLRSTAKTGKTCIRMDVVNAVTKQPVLNAHLSFVETIKKQTVTKKGVIVVEMNEGTYNYTLTAPGFGTRVGTVVANVGVMHRENVSMTAVGSEVAMAQSI